MSAVQNLFQPGETVERECDRHGRYTAQLVMGRAPCPDCVREQMAQHGAAVQAEVLRQSRREAVHAAGIPRRYADARTHQFDADAAEKSAWFLGRAAAGEACQLVLLGQVGTGKSHFGAAIAHAAAARGIAARYVTVSGYFRALRATWGHPERREERVFEDHASCPVLVLDDIGAGVEHANDAWRLHELIDARYSDERATVYVSNLPQEQLRKHLGDRAYDRMIDGARLIKLVGASRRRPVEGRGVA